MAMKDPCDGIKDILVAAGVGVFGATTGWSIHIGAQPKVPDSAIIINRAGGRAPFPHLLLSFPAIQIMVRGANGGYQAASDKADAIVDKLLGLTEVTFASGDILRSCTQIGDVFYMGQDDNGRPLFSCNFSLIIVPASGTHRQAIS